MSEIKERELSDFCPREYQIELFEIALKENVIIYLPTGCGKTFISAMVIKHLSKDISKKYTEGGKRSFFLVCTVALAQQQTQYLRGYIPFEVGTYTGDMGVDFWKMERWIQELDKNQVLVMTAQILLDMLQHDYISLSDINLIILDECHHAVNKHAMRQIMKLIVPSKKHNSPRIIGLTATLLNSNVKVQNIETEIHELEVTLQAKICRAKNEEMLKSFSANPDEEVVYYDNSIDSKLQSLLSVIDKSIKELRGYVAIVQPEEEEDDGPETMPDGSILVKTRKPISTKVNNMLADVTIVAEESGPFAASYALLSRLFNLERLKIAATDINVHHMYCMCITAIHKLRKVLRICMENHTAIDQPFIFSTSKLVALFQQLKNFPVGSSAIIFVTRRITAQSLYYVFKHLSTHNPDFKPVKPDFIVGVNASPYNLTRESELERKKNKETMKRFNSRETNVLFASNVVEEGIDVRHCNYVIKYDHPQTFCSYIQSKGRARHDAGKFIILAPTQCSDKKPFSVLHREYKQAEKKLKEDLKYEKSVRRQGGTPGEALFRIYRETPKGCEPFHVDGPNSACVTLESSINLLNRYCSMLPADKFTKLTVTYWKNEVDGQNIVVSLRLPMNSPLKGIVKGVPCENINLGKASAALEACKKLYKLNEFNSKLLPIGPVVEISEEDVFPLWVDQDDFDTCGKKANAKPGTKSRLRVYDRKVPRWMTGCTPKPNEMTYIHLIRISPNYNCQNTNRHTTFYNLLSLSNNFALLTSNKWPKVCEFPMFMNIGEVNIKMEENYAVKRFSQIELNEIFEFHCLLVSTALPNKKRFLVKDLDDGDYSYYITPVFEIPPHGFQIDWNIIKTHKTIPAAKRISNEERGHMVITKEKYQEKVVIPWYRPIDFKLKYIVTNVCEDLSPLSPFPSENYASYAQYFSDRYNCKVININQPLIEVRAISQKHNCLLPRGKIKLGKRKQRDEEDLEEILVPELCCLLEFPAVYLLKVTVIPSIMHRLSLLFLAEELRMKISSEVGLGKTLLTNDFVWERLKCDETVFNMDDDHPNQLKSTIEVSNMLASEMESLNPSDCPWDKADEPCDIDRNLETVDLLSIIYYDKFVNMILDIPDRGEKFLKSNAFSGNRAHGLDSSSTVPKIPFLTLDRNSPGPQLSELMQVLISNSGNDITNYERLETLGDSFLKFISCLVLYAQFPEKDEGKLSYLKGKIVGNRNLFYCGRNIKLGTMLKVNSFVPDDWDIPHYKLLDYLRKTLVDLKISPSCLFGLLLSDEEIDTSLLSEKSYHALLEIICNDRPNDESTPGGLQILQQEIVSDKYVADSVEALIGLYLKTCGIEGAFKLCQWLQICKWIPADDDELKDILYEPGPSAHINSLLSINDYLVNPDVFEEKFGYKFNDRSFLLQALSHSSYSQYATDCYQRLEFLGDAILDFLITCHIYNECGTLGPGDLTDLRSALVNNVTFACLTVRYGFDKFILTKAMLLSTFINKFSEQQEKRKHKIGAEVFLLVNESDVTIGEMSDVPKILGDVFESLAGAVYLDSGKSLQTVWKVFYRLMRKEIIEFSKKVPKNNIRLLYEKFPNPTPVFKRVDDWDNKVTQLMKVVITHNGETKEFFGYGVNKASAKMAAAKVALRHYHETDSSM